MTLRREAAEEMTDNKFFPGPKPGTVRLSDGLVLRVPEDWVLLAPGDAALTRRVKGAGDHWVVQEKKGGGLSAGGLGAGRDSRPNSHRPGGRACHRRLCETSTG